MVQHTQIKLSNDQPLQLCRSSLCLCSHCPPSITLMPQKYHGSSLSASTPFLDQSDLSIHLNSQSQVVRTRMAAVCCTLMAEVRVEPEWDLKDKLEGEIEWEMEHEGEQVEPGRTKNRV